MADVANPASQADIVSRGRVLAGSLAGRAAGCREARNLDGATIAEFTQTGLHRLLRPVHCGGWGFGVDAAVAVAEELGRGEAAQAWALAGFIEAAHGLGAFGAAAHDEVWGADSDALVAGSFLPYGTARAKDGGVVVSGRFPAVAGFDHAGWFLGGASLREGDAVTNVLFVVPKDAVKVIDEGATAGLEGAGLRSVAIEQVSVPTHRVLSGSALCERRGSLTLAAVPLGTAATMIATFEGLCKDMARRGRRVADNFATALRLAESKADVDAGLLSLVDAAARTMAAVARGEALDTESRALNSLKSAYGAALAVRAADRVFAAAGAKAILQSNPMQRFLLDVHAMGAQDVFGWDRAVSEYGLLRIA